MSEWSAGLLFAKAIKELTYKHLGQGMIPKAASFCVLGISGDERIMK
jgi:hypothetical protein